MTAGQVQQPSHAQAKALGALSLQSYDFQGKSMAMIILWTVCGV